MLPSQRSLFDIPRDVAYLNNGAYTPLPHPVRLAGEQGVARKSTPWRMTTEATTAEAERLRAAAARLIGATADDIAIIPAVAYGVATAAANLVVAPNTRILMIENEFPSLANAMARLAEQQGATLDIVPRPSDADWTAALLDRIAAPGLPPISIAALTPLSWTDGALVDLERLAPPLQAQGAAIIVDATHAAGILPLDVARIGADYMVFPTYKWLLGPYTLAFLYAAPHRQHGTPLEQHGTARQPGPFNGTLAPLIPTARRFDMGERMNPVSLPMGLAGIELVQSWGMPPTTARLRHLTDRLAAAAEAHGLTPVPRAHRAPHILGLRAPDTTALVARLEAQNIYVAERGGSIRIGAHAFNDEEDVDRFSKALGS